jgi:hypothetical protein
MKAILLATLRAAGITALCVPLVWLVFGGVTRSRSDAPPLGLQNIEWPVVPYGTYIAATGWAILGLIFTLALAIAVGRRRQGRPAGRTRRNVDWALMTLGAGVLAVAVVIGTGLLISATIGRTILENRSGGSCGIGNFTRGADGSCVEERLVDPDCTPGMYIQRLCDDSYYPDPRSPPPYGMGLVAPGTRAGT